MFRYEPSPYRKNSMVLVGDDEYADAVVKAARSEKSLARDIALVEMSLRKWKSIHDMLLSHPTLILYDGGHKTCALCHAYWPMCKKCPIAATTGKDACLGTPYDDYEKCLRQGAPASARQAALAEVTLLTEILNDLKARQRVRRRQMIKTGAGSIVSLTLSALAFRIGGGVEGPMLLEFTGLFFLIIGVFLAALLVVQLRVDSKLRRD